MNWYLILYIFAAIVIGTYPTMTFFQTGRTVSAVVYLIAAITVLIMFGLRWFEYGTGGESGTAWPPIINTCPDYLTYFKRPSSSDASGYTPSCIDLVGVSRNSVMAKWRPEFSTENPPEDDKYYFSLVTSAQDKKKRNEELCNRALEKGLSWEGITNGESCVSQTFPGGSTSGDNSKQCS